MTSNCFVSVVAPLFNDADLIEAFVLEVTAVLERHYSYYELILVDDRSTDGTVSRLSSLLPRLRGVRLICLSRSFGQEIAIAAGLDTAIGDYAVVMLPESDPPAAIPRLVDRARDGAAVVFGVATKRPPESPLRRLAVRLFYWCCNRILRLDMPPNTTHFRVMNRAALTALSQIKDRMRYLHTLSAYVGYDNQRFDYMPVFRRAVPRQKSFVESAALAFNILVTNSTHFLRVMSLAGLLAGAVNALVAFGIVARPLFSGYALDGWRVVYLQAAVMFLFLFALAAVLGEYVGSILREVRNRPLYYVQGEHNSAVAPVEPNVIEETRP